MQKYKVLKGGLTCQAINPYKVKNGPWHVFDLANPILPLTRQQDEGIEVEGELVWQCMYSWDSTKYYTVSDEWYEDMKTATGNKYRRALQPKSVTPDADLNWKAGMYDVHDAALDKFVPQYLTEQQIENFKKNNTWFQPIATNSKEEKLVSVIPRAGQEIASTSIETDLGIANIIIADLKRRLNSADELIEKLNARQSQTTQQPLIELLEKRIDRAKKQFENYNRYEFKYLEAELTELLKQLNNGN